VAHTKDIDVLIVGGGVVGLSAATAIAERGHSVCVVESHSRPGMEASTHNSGVIHAGLYYPPGSLKAKLCLEGRELLYGFCERTGVPYRRTGKLVVADDPSREGELEAIAANARANGARAEMLTAHEIDAHDSNTRAKLALWSPDTGIVDAPQLVLALAHRAAAAGAVVLTNTPVRSAAADRSGITLDTGREQIRASWIVNAAGLFADDVSAMLGGERFRIWPCRGDYAVLTAGAARRFHVPIYPLPERSGHGLGVHFTPTPDGSVLLGPTSRYLTSKTDYESNRPALPHFLEAARKIVRALSLEDLREGGSGIRAKLHPEHEHFADFMIRADANQPSVIQAAGIDSPGLTACLAIGRLVAALIA